MNEMISKHFVGVNFFTPNILAYNETDKYMYELSKGDSMFAGNNSKIYGVTVIDKSTLEKRNDLSDVFQSYTEAINYIDNYLT